MDTIDIKGLDKADVLIALYSAARPLGMGWLHETSAPMTREEASDIVTRSTRQSFDKTRTIISFDYVKGRPLKVDIGGDTLEPWLYDRDQGQGAASRAIASLRERLAAA